MLLKVSISNFTTHQARAQYDLEMLYRALLRSLSTQPFNEFNMSYIPINSIDIWSSASVYPTLDLHSVGHADFLGRVLSTAYWIVRVSLVHMLIF